MGDTGDPRDEDLAESTRRQNSNLRRLIDAVGTLLAGSREVLSRLQVLSGAEPPDTKRHPDTKTQGEQAASDTSPTDEQQPGTSRES